jgi:glycerophosphoryl diester phosphodiesterase
VPSIRKLQADINAVGTGWLALAEAAAEDAQAAAELLETVVNMTPFSGVTALNQTEYALPFTPPSVHMLTLSVGDRLLQPGTDYELIVGAGAPGFRLLFTDVPDGLPYWGRVERDSGYDYSPYPTRAAAIAATVPPEVTVLRYNHNGRVRDFIRSDTATGTATNAGTVFWKPQLGKQRNYSQAPSEFRPEVIAHRGFANCGPENTLISLSRAIRYSDSIEFDIAISADGTPWLFHDATVDVLTNGSGTFTDLTDAYIATLRLDGSGYGPEGPEYLTRLEDALLLVKQSGVIAYPEIKRVRADYEGDIDIVMDMIDAFGVAPQCRIGSFSQTHLSYVRSIDPDIGLSLFFSDAANPTAYNAAIAFSAAIGNCDVSWNMGNVDDVPTGPLAAYEAGAPVLAWTVTSAHTAQRTMRSNVNRLFTDHPLNARRFR